MAELCHCGRPLHYSDPEIRRVVDALVGEYGEYVPVTVTYPEPRTFLVPRHYIALHGLKGWEVRTLGFEEVQ